MLVLAALAPRTPGVAGQPDRLDRFRQLALARDGLRQVDAESPDAYREMYALLDEEIVESLASGGVFASPGFLQERLDGFSEAWGAAALGVVGVGRLVVGAFQLSDAPGVNTVRVYGRLGGEAALLATVHREGRPVVLPLPPAPGGAPQFLAAWEGGASGWGTRALRIELVRQDGDGVRTAWSTAEQYPEGLLARSWALRGGALRVRYELRYPGWTPGCAAQTEREDVWRLAPVGGAFARVGRVQHHAWHRELRAVVARFLDAVAAGDGKAVAALVPDPALRRRLPARLAAEPACDAPDDATRPRTVSVAATGDGAPWELTWERAGTTWRLTAASRVLQ
ncbi:MAG: hypothetical protein A3E31_13735 [Candidatus Rokubacteria bacterium RIFCSPHIGHO2_12_FULL_73_22]|nr:MAG: hypothetical protein A3E31_13735 [Candidatus Rokubacteria bacterium RIFCSPHIGHO2_12_FULL_73_22]OGL02067.1 MAG: hypothetical protein A3D33_04140 [Candidatus Rokubacteria bacterium RIFCSPHIGHO2_02_FULL_73_26]OGL09265.1 MAG: hypothetical protein A3I14_03735 [Candidatus Rokubacteria bacterium RIFCSPLOWO2_02_FULL_73_56]OGL29107.1 MAG: hypothetical protein A3G44_05905 [Candidatus Rokubacteria bacterium RIFCSPLOWO2_12_FULL_73_47]